MIKRIYLSLALTIGLIISGRSATIDFSFPETASVQSREMLMTGLQAGDAVKSVRGLLDYAIAVNRKDPKRLDEIPALIDSLAPESGVTKAMFDMVSATIYSSIYNRDKWNFDQRRLPETFESADLSEWDGRMFRKAIYEGIEGALRYRDELINIPIERWGDVVSLKREDRIYYPTLYDFVCQQSINLLGNIDDRESREKIDGIYKSWIRECESRRNVAAQINAEIGRINGSGDREEGLKSLYELFKESEYSGDILIALGTSSTADQSEMAEMLRRNISQFRTYPRKGCLENMLSQIEQASMNVIYPRRVAVGCPTEIKVEYRNVAAGRVDIYYIPGLGVNTGESMRNVSGIDGFRRVATFNVGSRGTKPFEETATFTYDFPMQGCYIAVGSVTLADTPEQERYELIKAEGLTVIPYRRGPVYVGNPQDGSPVVGAEVTIYGGDREVLSRVETDEMGLAYFDFGPGRRGTVYAQKGELVSSLVDLQNYYYSTTRDTNSRVEGYTDLSVYRPGGTVKWVGVMRSDDGTQAWPQADEIVKVRLIDANWQTVTETEGVTDVWGRVTGEFLLPGGGLQGDYQIEFSDTENKRLGSCSFTVSDYKLPTFMVELDRVGTDVPTAGSARISGRVMGYNGVALSYVNVNVEVSYESAFRLYYSRYGYRQGELFNETVETDGEGRFSMVVPKSSFEALGTGKFVYRVTASATSGAGETQSAETMFAMGAVWSLEGTLPTVIDASEGEVNLGIEVKDIEDNTINTTLAVSFKSGDETIYKTEVNSGSARIEVGAIPTGEYTLEVECVEPDRMDPVSVGTVVYRQDDRHSPVKDLLWTPTNYVSSESLADGGLMVEASSATTGVWILSYNDEIVSKGTVRLHEGMNKVVIPMTPDRDHYTLSMAAVYGSKVSTLSVNATTESMRETLEMTVSSFRDHLTPGDSETWKINVRSSREGQVSAALIAEMYNQALDALRPHDFNMWSYSPRTTTLGFYGVNRYNGSQWISGRMAARRDCRSIERPEFNLYGYSFDYLQTQLMSYTRSRPMANMAMSVDGADMAYASVEEAETESDGAMGKQQMGNDGEEPAGFAYRDSEVTLGFFRPMLTTNESGEAELTFTVPNANATWSVRIMGYTRQMMAANYSGSVITTRPIMAQSNLPRFLRYGDEPTLQSLVFNNSEEAQTVVTTVELFSPIDGRILKREEYRNVIRANETATVSTSIDKLPEGSMLGYRIKSVAGNYSDGEQSVIPLLEATTPVIDVMSFYMQRGEETRRIELPEVGLEDRVTIEYTGNPIWSVVTALPGLMSENTRTSTGAATRLFSAAMSAGIIKSNPTIGEALKEWLSSDRSDSTLVSMLSRNAELKNFLLTETPWVSAAMSDTERMERLSQLFDKGVAEEMCQSSITMLKNLQTGDGSIKWCGGSTTGSLWATYEVLTLLGKLEELDMLPKSRELTDIITGALRYIDEEEGESYRRYPGQNRMDYVRLRDMFSQYPVYNVDARRAIESTVQGVIGRWENLSLAQKGEAALILEAHGYRSMAKRVLESVSEFATYDPEKGMSWPSLQTTWYGGMDVNGITGLLLNAYATVEPNSEAIGRIIQWLVLQKRAQNWGSTVGTMSVCEAILRCGRDLLNSNTTTTFTVEGRPLKTESIDSRLGYYKIGLTDCSGATLGIHRQDASPSSYGAVYVTHTEPFERITPSSTDELSIEKHLFVMDGDRAVEVGDRELRVGDKVRVSLLVHSNANLQYVAIEDMRPSSFEPVEQLPGTVWSEGVAFYRESGDSSTSLFIQNLPRGTYWLTYDVTVTMSGRYVSGIATAQSQYAPSISAHSGGMIVKVEPQ